MQYKVLLLANIFFIVSSVSSVGQEYQELTLPAKTKKIVIHTDTTNMARQTKLVLPKYPQPATTPKQQAAEEEKKQDKPVLVTRQTADSSDKNKYKAVPLAGHKAYFGSMNDYVIEYTKNYMARHNKTLSVVQDRSNKHFSLIDTVLQQHNIPKELKYLAVIESALNNNARSRVGAVGPWQFMAPTARLMGLTVNSKRDDRKDWFKSTNAAAKYLNYLYGELNDWLLVIAAYNSGPSPVQRAIQKTGSRNFWDIKKYLPKETQGHVLAFIATATIFENMSKFIGLGYVPSDFNFSAPNEVVETKKAAPQPKVQFTEDELKNMAIVRINEPVHMEFLAHDLDIDMNLLKKWNPDYDLFEMNTYDKDFYSLRIPKEKLENFISKKEYIIKKSRVIYADMGI
jgi:membrane-bound lytic murein transglycosylase D